MQQLMKAAGRHGQEVSAALWSEQLQMLASWEEAYCPNQKAEIYCLHPESFSASQMVQVKEMP